MNDKKLMLESVSMLKTWGYFVEDSVKDLVKSLAKKNKLGNWTVRGGSELFNKDTGVRIKIASTDADSLLKQMGGSGGAKKGTKSVATLAPSKPAKVEPKKSEPMKLNWKKRIEGFDGKTWDMYSVMLGRVRVEWNGAADTLRMMIGGQMALWRPGSFEDAKEIVAKMAAQLIDVRSMNALMNLSQEYPELEKKKGSPSKPAKAVAEKPKKSDSPFTPEEEAQIFRAAANTWQEIGSDAEELGATKVSDAVELVADADRMSGRMDKDLYRRFSDWDWKEKEKWLKKNSNRWY